MAVIFKTTLLSSLMLFAAPSIGDVGHSTKPAPFQPKSSSCTLQEILKLEINFFSQFVPLVGGTLSDIAGLVFDCSDQEEVFRQLIAYIFEEVDIRIDAAKAELLRNDMLGFNRTMQLLTLDKKDTDPNALYALYMDYTQATPRFANTKVPEAAAYFREFAFLKISLLRLLKQVMPDKDMKPDIKELIAAGEDMFRTVPNAHINKYEDAFRGYQVRMRLNRVLRSSLQKWRQVADGESAADPTDGYAVRDGDWLAMRSGPGAEDPRGKYNPGHRWIDCGSRPTSCQLETCPGQYGPWGRQGKSDPNRCRGSIFRIYAPSRADRDEIKSCDRVFFQYGQGSWLSHVSGSNGWAPKVMPCPGKDFNRAAAKNTNWCDKEQWNIQIVGKECGERLEHLDDIILCNEGNTYCFIRGRRASFTPGIFSVENRTQGFYDTRTGHYVHDRRLAYFTVFKEGLPNVYEYTYPKAEGTAMYEINFNWMKPRLEVSGGRRKCTNREMLAILLLLVVVKQQLL